MHLWAVCCLHPLVAHKRMLPCTCCGAHIGSAAAQEFQAKAVEWQKGMAERESAVTVREVACCSVEARLAQRSAQLEDWEGRLRTKAGHLESVQATLQVWTPTPCSSQGTCGAL